jgi:hypothetical protein
MRFHPIIVAVTLALLAASGGAMVAPIGKALRASQSLNATGHAGTRVLTSNGEVFFLDRITSSSSGAGEFEFNDGTKLAIGSSANVVVDQFVVGDNSSFQKLGISATKGAFRWISGSSPSSAYHIQTPVGTMGIRGTAFDLTVKNGRTYLLLLNGNATFCGRSKCQTLNRACDYIVADGSSVSKKKPVSAAFKNLHDAEKLFPYSANPGRLSSRFRVAGSSCLRTIKVQNDNTTTPKTIVTTETAEPSPREPAPPPPVPGGNHCGGNCGNGQGNGGGNGTGNEGHHEH